MNNFCKINIPNIFRCVNLTHQRGIFLKQLGSVNYMNVFSTNQRMEKYCASIAITKN